MDHTKATTPEPLADLAPEARALMVRLLAVVSANGFSLPKEMLEDIESISVHGADPDWQIERMKQILDRWAPRH